MRIVALGLSRDAELAAQRGDVAEALRGFLDAGDRAVGYQLWRTAARCYRGALELDLIRREPVARLVKIAARVGSQLEWNAYARVLDDMPAWPHFGCRTTRILTNDTGSIVECPEAGPVLELIMSAADRVEAHADGRFSKMPLAMALVILRRALWSNPRAVANKPARVTIQYAGRSPVWLDERGDWAPL
jgi:hypothetical protein